MDCNPDYTGKATHGLFLVNPSEEMQRRTLEHIRAHTPWVSVPKRHKSKAYEAPYQFPRDLLEAIEDYYELRPDHDDFQWTGDVERQEAILDQIRAWVETLEQNATAKLEG